MSAINGSCIILIIEQGVDHFKKINFYRTPDGISSLYFLEKDHGFLFCSEQRILISQQEQPEIAYENIAELLSFRYVHAPRTLIKKLKALPAGYHLQIHENGQQNLENVTLYNWCGIQTATSQVSSQEMERIVEKTSVAIQHSIKRRIRPNTSLFLSGGIDSSVLLQHMCSIQDPPQTFTIVLEGLQSNEIPFAARVSKIMGAKHEVIQIHPEQFIDGLYQATKS